MNQMNQNATIGEKFEQRFLQELQARFKLAKTSRSTDHMFICDIVHDDCLIELKSTRDKYNETTVETFTRICKYGLKDFKKNGIKKGLFFQIIEMLKFERSMVIAGTYKIEPNKLYNLWIRNPDQAWSNYTEYKIMTHWCAGSTYTRIPAREFWALADQSHSLTNFKGKLEDYADQHSAFLEWNNRNHMYDSEFLGALLSLNLGIPSDQIESLFDGPLKGLSQPNQRPQTWIEKEKQAQLEPVEAVAEPVEAVAEPVEAVAESVEAVAEPTEDIIDQISVFSKEKLLMIRESIKDHVSLNDISKKLGKSVSYLTNILNAEHNSTNGYRDGQWALVRKWLEPILLESKHPQTPLWICNEDDLRSLIESLRNENKSIRSSVSKSKKSIEKLESKLIEIKAQLNEKTLIINDYCGTISEHENRHTKQRNEINELKAKLNSQETKQVDETTTLKLEAYQAEIKKLQTQLEELQTAFDKLIDEAVTMNLTIKDQKLEIEQLKASSSTIKDQQIIDSLLLLIEKLK